MPKDPYKYFRIEARELLDGLKQGALDLEKGDPTGELVARLLRLAHTLKGAARVVKLPVVADRAHAIEDLLAAHREGGAVPPARVDELLALVDAADAASMASLASPTTVASPPDEDAASAQQTSRGAPAAEAVRVEIEEMDRLLDGVAEATSQLGSLRREVTALERAHQLSALLVERLERSRDAGASARQAQALVQLRDELARLRRSVDESVSQVGAELVQVRDSANRLRLMPVSTVFATLERAARDAAHALGKRIDFRASGGAARLDAHVLATLQEALLHMVRNAVAHGVETPAARRQAGKPEAGVVELRVERRGSKVTFACRDDGRGVDVDGLRRAAVERGLLDEDDRGRTLDDLMRLTLRGGLTTTSSVTQLSGRAIGLDVVRDVAARLRGTVQVSTEPGAGTSFEITVPVSVSSLVALVVSGGGVTGSVPLGSVRRILRVTQADLARSGDGESLLFEGKVIPFAPLARVLRRPRRDAESPRAAWSAFVVEAGASLAAIGVDRLHGTAEVVVRPLPAELEADPVVAGASLDSEGNPDLVFDPAGLVDNARTGYAPPAEARPRHPILVVDDSLTTRMLEQSILESAGYDVDLATSAEEALEKARLRRYGVFVVDVEMPGMDGFEFVARTRADAALREVPAILVTSRGADEDRQRGRDAGAHAYIVKGEFDQGLLLQTIRELDR